MSHTYLDLDEDLERPVVTRPPLRRPLAPPEPVPTAVRYPPGPVPDVEDEVRRAAGPTRAWPLMVRRVRALVPSRPWPRHRVVAGLLGMFLGALGLHALYLGHRRRGLTMLATTVVGGALTFGLAAVLMGACGFVEGLLVLCARRGRFARDAWGRPLRG